MTHRSIPSLFLGWLVIVAAMAPVVGAYLVFGEEGPIAVMLLYIGLLILVLLSMMAFAVGEIVKSYRR